MPNSHRFATDSQNVQTNRRSMHRRTMLATIAASATMGVTGCLPSTSASEGTLEEVWGKRGQRKGQFQRPRAITVDDEDRLYIVDMTGRIQVFDRGGVFQRAWRTPTIENGRPSGLGISRDGLIMVADTHYFQVLFYTKLGEPQPNRTLGGTCGNSPGEFNFVTDVVQDSLGNYYVADYGEVDRIQKLDPNGQSIYQWGSQGSGKRQFQRPNSLAMGPNDHLWVADACNHRIQVYDVAVSAPRLVQVWGSHGVAAGQLRYPYDLILTDDENLIVVEFGNHRVQKFGLDGQAVASFGSAGRDEGQFTQPWGAAVDSRNRVHVLDSYNHRVQRIRI